MNKGKRFKKKEKKIILFRLIFLVIIIILILEFYNQIQKTNDKVIDNNIQTNLQSAENIQQQEKTEKMVLLEDFQKENSDIVAWLQIEGTKINYPVLQGQDNDYYMTHNYKKEYSKDGSLFLDKEYDWSLPSTNLLIYGHNNIGSKEMFADLMKYKNKTYYNSHKTIKLTTNDEEAEYEIISVFLSRVYYKSEKDAFRYYYFINAENEEKFNEYVNKSKEASLYDIEATAKYGEQLLTLSTCEYSQKDGRLAIVARKIY